MTFPSTMRYISTDPENSNVLSVVEGPLPQIGAGEVLVRTIAAGVNRADVLQRMGRYPLPPGMSNVLGLEIAGEIVACAAGVSQWQKGDKICALVNAGGYAEYCAVPAVQCFPWPKGYDAVQAAALPEAFLTVWANLFAKDRFVKGKSYLIHGGTSGIGSTAIQLVKEFGGEVYATAGSDRKCEVCVELGARAAINYKDRDFVRELHSLTGGRGVDVILDIVGGPYFQRNLSALAHRGKLVMIAFMEGDKLNELTCAPIVVKHLTITGSTLRPRSTEEKGELVSELRERVWSILDAGRCRPIVHQVFPLAEATAAHALMESSRHIGKIILEVA